MNNQEILTFAKNIIHKEVVEIQRMAEMLDDCFVETIELLRNCEGKVVVMGVGKNAPIAQKMVATLNSTGTVAQFLHAGEALHGDIGLIQKKDICIIISKSGNTAEIKSVLPSVKEFSAKTIAICGNITSYLAQHADIVLNTTILQEAGPERLAPTSSTTVQLVLCDAIAMVLKKLKNFNSEDFGRVHPGGSLGKQLLLKVEDILDGMHRPQVDIDADIKTVIESLSSGRFGITVVMNKSEIVGVITDGDLRRMLEKYSSFEHISARDIATFHPKIIHKSTLARKALQIINMHKIGQLIVVGDDNEYVGIIDFHGLTNEGIRAEE
ncbi:MAG: KpsF/GutQ family sugar-phosphate isomerase [Flavobacteriaceae bacterium]|nr:KpsF/GutQ family sugar-phosphate isomerase [Flavobacteriaceae bacterium]